MQFKPDCQIYIALASRGKPEKYAVGVHIQDQSGRAGVKYRKYLGKVHSSEAARIALNSALDQAERLHKEKIEIILDDAGIIEILNTPLPAGKKMKGQPDALTLKVSKFRMWRAKRGTPTDLAIAQEIAQAAMERS